MIENAIYIENVSYFFGKVKALDNLSLEVKQGIIFGFLGPNGAGKTTTIRLLLGLLALASGKIEVMGLNTHTQAELIRCQTGVLLEHHGLYEQLSAKDNLEFYGRSYQIPAIERQKRIKELLEQNNLWERRNDQVKSFSRGMKQKLAICRALLHKPPLILLDEPTAGLDVTAAAEIRQHLASLTTKQGVTVFLTTHNMAEAEKLCQGVAVIREGRLIAQGHPNDLRLHTGKPKLEIRAQQVTEEVINMLRAKREVSDTKTQGDKLVIELQQETNSAPLISLLVEAGVQVEEVHRGQSSLEDVYLTLVKEENA
jgi:ABC-2 type transport system ATP-binding protein